MSNKSQGESKISIRVVNPPSTGDLLDEYYRKGGFTPPRTDSHRERPLPAARSPRRGTE